MTRGAAWVSCLAIALAAPATTLAQGSPAESGDILAAIQLPSAAQTLRDRGIPAVEVSVAVAGARNNDMDAGQLTVIFRQTAATMAEHGPIENFGAFVQRQLRAGLRGRELAEAIRAEHARRGIGRGKSVSGQGRGQQGGPGAAGRALGRGRSGGAQGNEIRRGPHGRPDGAASTLPSWLADVAAAGAAIERRPSAADSILQAHRMTRATFNARLCEVAAEPTLTAAYQKARGK
jgi:hypothetical protein